MSIQPVQDILAPAQEPERVLEFAHRAARALVRLVSQNEAQYVVRLGQGRYLRFEAWQTLGAFFGLSCRIEWTRPIEGGWEARAVAIRGDHIVSAAESQCTADEPAWRAKPGFQLRSMAQTRAMAKALRQALAWVVVLAGYQPMPAEEVEVSVAHPNTSAPDTTAETAIVTNDQRRAIWAKWRELAEEAGFGPSAAEALRALVRARFGVEHSRSLTVAQARELLDFLYSVSPSEIAQVVEGVSHATQLPRDQTHRHREKQEAGR